MPDRRRKSPEGSHRGRILKDPSYSSSSAPRYDDAQSSQQQQQSQYPQYPPQYAPPPQQQYPQYPPQYPPQQQNQYPPPPHGQYGPPPAMSQTQPHPRPRSPARYPSSSSSSGSSSSSYLDISHSYPPKRSGFRTFFTAPSERRRLRKRRSGKLSKHSNSSSSSVGDLAYGTGFVKKKKVKRSRSKKGKEVERDGDGRVRGERPGGQGAGAGERAPGVAVAGASKHSSHSTVGKTDAEILAIGAGLAKIARDQNKQDLKSGSRNGGRLDLSAVAGVGGQPYAASRGLAPSKVSHKPDEDGWESASDDESASSVDLNLAFGNESTVGFWPWSKKQHKPVSRKDTLVDPRLFGRQNSLHGIITEPVGFDGNVTWTSTTDFGPQNFIPTEPGFPSYPGSNSGSQVSLQHVFPVTTSDPHRVDAVRAGGSVVPRPEQYTSQSRPDPVPIQHPTPRTPVSQSVYETPTHTRSHSGRIFKDGGDSHKESPSGRGTSIAGIALAGVGGVVAASAIADLKDDRKEKRREDERREEERSKRREDDRREEERRSRREDERKEEERSRRREEERREEERLKRKEDERREEERLRRREKENRRESPDRKSKDKEKRKSSSKYSADEDRRDKKSDKKRDEAREEKEKEKRREKRREDKQSEHGDERYEGRRTRIDTAVPQTSVDPFQYQVNDLRFDPGQTAVSAPGRGGSTPTVVTVDREPDFARDRNSAVRQVPSYALDRQTYPDYDDRDREYRDREARDIHSETGPPPANGYRESRSIERRKERSAEIEPEYDDRKNTSRDQESVRGREPSQEKERDPIQEEADRAYRETVMARKIASQVIRSRETSPDRSVIHKYDHEDAQEIIRIETPPEMKEHPNTKGLYEAPNADFVPDYILRDPRELHSLKIQPTISDSSNPEVAYLKRDPGADRPRPHLNLVHPTPSHSPLPEKQVSRSEPKEATKSKEVTDVPEVVIGPKGDVVVATSPTSSNVSKAVTWGKNETKHFEVESPDEHRDEFVTKKEAKARERVEEPQSAGTSARGWGTIAAGIGAIATASATKAIEGPRTPTSREEDAYEYRGVTVEPEPLSRDEQQPSPPSPGPKPPSPSYSQSFSKPLPQKYAQPPAPRSPQIPGAFDDDLDFTAHVAAGLQDTGFDPNIVINDPSFRRRDSPPGSNEAVQPSLYRAPFAETVTDLGVAPSGSQGDREFVIGDENRISTEWRSGSPEGDDTPSKLSRKEQKKRDKEAKRQSSDVTPIGDTSNREIVEEPESYFEEPKLSKKEQKKRDKEAQRERSQSGDVTPLVETIAVAPLVMDDPESYFETPKKSKKKSKKGSNYDAEVEDSPRNVTVPIDAFDDLQNAGEDWNEPKKSKKKSKRDSEVFDSPARSAPSSEVGADLERSSSKKSKDKSKRRSDVYEPSPSEISLPASEPSETSQAGEFYEATSSKKSNRDSGIFDRADRDDSRSVVSTSRLEDEPRRKKGSRSGAKDDFDDTRSVASAPAGDEDDKKKKDKKSGGGFFGLFGSKSDVGAKDEAPKTPKDDVEDSKKKSKKEKRRSDGGSIYGNSGTSSVNDLSRSVSNGNSNGSSHYDDDPDGGTRSDGERRKTRSRGESTSSKRDSFLDNTGTLGAGVGIVGVAAVLTAQHHQQSKANNADSRGLTEHELSVSHEEPLLQQQEQVLDPEIMQRRIRPAIDPQYGDLLPLPPSAPGTPHGVFNEFPDLPESRPGTPEIDRTSRATLRKSFIDTPMKSPSQSAMPLTFRFGNRSIPSSPAPFRSPTTLSAETTQQEPSNLPRTRPSRPTSWDSTKEYKPLYLVESTRKPRKPDEVEEELPELPASKSTSRSSSKHDFDERSRDVEYDTHLTPQVHFADSLTIDTELASSHIPSDVLGSQQSTPKAGVPHDFGDFEAGVLDPIESPTLPSQGPDRSPYPVADKSRSLEDYATTTVAVVGAASAIGYLASSPRFPMPKENWMDDLPTVERQPSPVDPMTKNRSSYLLHSSPMARMHEDIESTSQDAGSPVARKFGSHRSIHSIEEQEGAVAFELLDEAPSLPISQEEEPVLPVLPAEDSIDESTFSKSKKDKKKDKKKGKGISRSSTHDDLALPQPSTDIVPEIPAAEDMALAGISGSDSPKPKKGKGKDKKKNLSILALAEAESEVVDSIEEVGEPATEFPSTVEADPSDEFALPKSKKDKKKDKKKKSASSPWEEDENNQASSESKTRELEPVLSANLEDAPPMVEPGPSDEFSTSKSKKDKKKDRKKGKLAPALEEPAGAASTAPHVQEAVSEDPSTLQTQGLAEDTPKITDEFLLPASKTDSFDEIDLLQSKNDKLEHQDRDDSFATGDVSAGDVSTALLPRDLNEFPATIESAPMDTFASPKSKMEENTALNLPDEVAESAVVETPVDELTADEFHDASEGRITPSDAGIDIFSTPEARKEKEPRGFYWGADEDRRATILQPVFTQTIQDALQGEASVLPAAEISQEPLPSTHSDKLREADPIDEFFAPKSKKDKKKDKKSKKSSFQSEISDESTQVSPAPNEESKPKEYDGLSGTLEAVTSTPEVTPDTARDVTSSLEKPLPETLDPPPTSTQEDVLPVEASDLKFSSTDSQNEFATPKSKKDKKKRRNDFAELDTAQPSLESFQEATESTIQPSAEPTSAILDAGPEVEFSVSKPKKDKKGKKSRNSVAWEDQSGPSSLDTPEDPPSQSQIVLEEQKRLVAEDETTSTPTETETFDEFVVPSKKDKKKGKKGKSPLSWEDSSKSQELQEPDESVIASGQELVDQPPEVLHETSTLLDDAAPEEFSFSKSKKDKKKGKKSQSASAWEETPELKASQEAEDPLATSSREFLDETPSKPDLPGSSTAPLESDGADESFLPKSKKDKKKDKKKGKKTGKTLSTLEADPGVPKSLDDLATEDPVSGIVEEPTVQLDEEPQPQDLDSTKHETSLPELQLKSEAYEEHETAPQIQQMTTSNETAPEILDSEIVPLEAQRNAGDSEQVDVFPAPKSKKDKKKDKKKAASIAWDEDVPEETSLSGFGPDAKDDIVEEPTATEEFGPSDTKKSKKSKRKSARFETPEDTSEFPPEDLHEPKLETTDVSTPDEPAFTESKKDKKKKKRSSIVQTSDDRDVPTSDQQNENILDQTADTIVAATGLATLGLGTATLLQNQPEQAEVETRDGLEAGYNNDQLSLARQLQEEFAAGTKKSKKDKKKRQSLPSTPDPEVSRSRATDETTPEQPRARSLSSGPAATTSLDSPTPALRPNPYSEDQLELAKQLKAEFNIGDKKSKKDKKNRQSLSRSATFDDYSLNEGSEEPSAFATPLEEPRAALPRDNPERDGLEDQISLASQLKAEDESGKKKSKKDKKKRDPSRSATQEDIPVEATTDEPSEFVKPFEEPQSIVPADNLKRDGLEAGYQEDQLSLARQLQAEFGKKSKKDKKRQSTSQTPLDQDPRTDYFGDVSQLPPADPIQAEASTHDFDSAVVDTPPVRDGLAVGYNEDQLELARQLKEEFSSGSKKSKKDKKGKKRDSMLRSNTEDDFTPDFASRDLGEQPSSQIPEAVTPFGEEETVPTPQEDFAPVTKKSKKDKKGKNRESLLQGNAEDEFSSEMQASEVVDSQKDDLIVPRNVEESEGAFSTEPVDDFSPAPKKSKDKKGKKRASTVLDVSEDTKLQPVPTSSELSRGTEITQPSVEASETVEIPTEDLVLSTKKSKKDKKGKKRDSVAPTLNEETQESNDLSQPLDETQHEAPPVSSLDDTKELDISQKESLEAADLGESFPEDQFTKKSKKEKKKKRDSSFPPPKPEVVVLTESSSKEDDIAKTDAAQEIEKPYAEIKSEHVTLPEDSEQGKKGKEREIDVQASMEEQSSPYNFEDAVAALHNASISQAKDVGIIEAATVADGDSISLSESAKKTEEERNDRQSLTAENLPLDQPDPEAGPLQSSPNEDSNADLTTLNPADEGNANDLWPSSKKSKKDKKRKSLQQSSTFEEQTPEQQLGIAPVSEAQELPDGDLQRDALAAIPDTADGFELPDKKSKKDKKKRKSLQQVSTFEDATANVKEAIPVESRVEENTIKDDLVSNTEAEAPNSASQQSQQSHKIESATDTPQEDIPDATFDDYAFSLKKSKKDKKKGKGSKSDSNNASGVSTPSDPNLVLGKSSVPSLQDEDAEGKVSEAIPDPLPDAIQDDEWAPSFSTKKSKKGKKKASGLSTPIQDDSKPDLMERELPKEDLQSGLLQADTAPEPENDFPQTFPTNNSKKDKKKKASEVSNSVVDEPAPGSPVALLEPDLPKQDSQPEIPTKAVPPPDEEWESKPTKKAKKDKKKSRSGISTPLEESSVLSKSDDALVKEQLPRELEISAPSATEVLDLDDHRESDILSKPAEAVLPQLSAALDPAVDDVERQDEASPIPSQETAVRSEPEMSEPATKSLGTPVAQSSVEFSVPVSTPSPDMPLSVDPETQDVEISASGQFSEPAQDPVAEGEAVSSLDAFVTKKSKKDKKGKKSGDSTPLEQTLTASEKNDTPSEEIVNIPEASDDWGGFATKKSKKDKKGKKSGTLTLSDDVPTASAEVAIPESSTRDISSISQPTRESEAEVKSWTSKKDKKKGKKQQSTPSLTQDEPSSVIEEANTPDACAEPLIQKVEAISSADSREPQDEWETSTKASKKDKKKRKSGFSTPAEEPSKSLELETTLVGEAPISDLEAAVPSTAAESIQDVEPEAEWGVSRKSSKKDKKKKKSGSSTPAESRLALVEPELLNEGEASSNRDLDPTVPLPEASQTLDGESSLISTKTTKKDKKKQRLSGLSTPLEDVPNPIEDEQVAQISQTPASEDKTTESPSFADTTLENSPQVQETEPIVDKSLGDDRDIGFAIKPSKKDKKKKGSIPSIPVEPGSVSEPSTSFDASDSFMRLPNPSDYQELAQKPPVQDSKQGAILDASSSAPLVANTTDDLSASQESIDPLNPGGDGTQAPSLKESKKGKKGKQASRTASETGPNPSESATPLERNLEPEGTIQPAELSRKSSKKDKKKRQATLDILPTEEPTPIKPSTSWADEVEEAEMERDVPMIEKNESLSKIASTTEATSFSDFSRPSKKGKKGKNRQSDDLGAVNEFKTTGFDASAAKEDQKASSVPILSTLAVGVAAIGAVDDAVQGTLSQDKNAPPPSRKLSKKEKKKSKSIDRRTPREDIFDDDELWSGKDPKVHEETREGPGDDDGSDGFWSPPQDDQAMEITEEPLEIEETNELFQEALEQSKSIDSPPTMEAEPEIDNQPIRGSPEVIQSENIPASKKQDKGSRDISRDPEESTATITDPTRSHPVTTMATFDNPVLAKETLTDTPSISRDNYFTPTRAERIIAEETQLERSPFRPLSSSKFSVYGFSDLPAVVEEDHLPHVEHEEPKSYDNLDLSTNRDSAFVSGSPTPGYQKLASPHEPIRDSGVHVRDSSPFERTRETISSSEDAIARLSWPSVDDEAESVDLHRSIRSSPLVHKRHSPSTFKETGSSIRREAHASQSLSDTKPKDRFASTPVKAIQDFSSPQHEHARHRDLDSLQRAKEKGPVELFPSPKYDLRSPDPSKHRTPDATHRDLLPSQRLQDTPTTDLHRTQAIQGRSSRSKEESLVKQRVHRFESPDSQRVEKPKADKYGGIGSAPRPVADKSRSASDNMLAGAAIGAGVIGFAAARQSSLEKRPESAQSQRSISNPNINRLRTPDPKLMRPDSALSNRSGTPPLRRTDRRLSGDLRSLSQRSKPDLAKEAELAGITVATQNTANPTANEGRVRAKEMTDVYDGFGEGRMGSPRSPTRPHSMRRRQSMQVLELESKVEQLAAENRSLADARAQAERSLQSTVHSSASLVEKDAEIDALKRTLDWLQNEVKRLAEVNDGLMSANITLGDQQNQKYGMLESKHADATRELAEVRHSHDALTSGMVGMVAGSVIQDKDREIARLLAELESANEKVRAMQRQILASKANNSEFLVVRDEDYFDNACQQLCQHVQQWVLRFSKFSDMRACRLTSEINNDKTIDRLDNAILDGSDVDSYLADRVKRRDVFMSMTMTMVWEFIFTRYLFGMDREQRQKLKSLEKLLLEVGPASAVHQWRATTLTLLSKRAAFIQQREQDTEAVVHAVLETLSEILPPPSQLEGQIEEQLKRVIKAAVDLSIEMRTQRAEYMMLPPLQPEYDANGDLASKVSFNAALMNERSGDTVSNEQLEEQRAVVRIVLFPLVVKKGDDKGEGDEEIVVCPAQVLVANKPKRVRVMSPGSMVGLNKATNASRVSMQSGLPMETGDI